MEIFAAMLWFALVTAAITFALPRILDALLYYYDHRATQLNNEVKLHQRKLEIMQQQYEVQERGQRRPGR